MNVCVNHGRSTKVIKLVPEFLLKKRKTYQAIKATQAKLALLEKRKVRDEKGFQQFSAPDVTKLELPRCSTFTSGMIELIVAAVFLKYFL